MCVQFEGILAVHEFHVWRLAGQKIIATVHVRFRSLHDYMEGADKVTCCLGMHPT
jgi:zinc transporter 1